MGIKLNITVDVSVSSALKGIIKDALDAAAENVAVEIERDSMPYVPMDTGMLQSNVEIEKRAENERIINWHQPYAIYQWYGVGMKNYTTPGTGPLWVEQALGEHQGEWTETVKETIEGYL